MAVPDEVRAAEALVAAFCAEQVPPGLEDEIRIDHSVRGRSITIHEHRPPWDPEMGPEWSSRRVAQIRWDAETGRWTLYCTDRNERWWRYELVGPTRDVGNLLAEVRDDPTGIFWG